MFSFRNPAIPGVTAVQVPLKSWNLPSVLSPIKLCKFTSESSPQASALPSVLSSPGYPPRLRVTTANSVTPPQVLVYVNSCSPEFLTSQRLTIPVVRYRAKKLAGSLVDQVPSGSCVPRYGLRSKALFASSLSFSQMVTEALLPSHCE